MISLEEMSMLTTLYAQPHRHYHNINHINDCLTELENIPAKLITDTEREIVEVAIWYHDAVYNPYSRKNEINSAALYSQRSYRTAFGKAVYDAIIATGFHTITQTADRMIYIDSGMPLTTQVMLDIDLSGFGKPWNICKRHSENIYMEYPNTSTLEFYQGRIKFLETINARESLYYTDYFKEKYHKQSKENIDVEIKIAKEIIGDYNQVNW